MSDYVIVTDSTSDLPPILLQEHGIHVVPLKVVFGEQVLEDGAECTGETVFERVRNSGQLPKTTAAAPADFASVFEKIIQSGKKALYVGISSEFSSTVQNARIAAEDFPGDAVEVVDSRNLSTGIGLLVMKAADFRAQGKSCRETAEALRSMTDQVKSGFVIETLEYLHKGGRLSSISHLVGSMLKIKPFVRVADGKMTVAEKLRGSSRKAIDAMLGHALADKEIIDPSRVFVTHAAAREAADDLKERLEKELAVNEVLVTEAGSVISSHCGPGTIGILYMINP